MAAPALGIADDVVLKRTAVHRELALAEDAEAGIEVVAERSAVDDDLGRLVVRFLHRACCKDGGALPDVLKDCAVLDGNDRPIGIDGIIVEIAEHGAGLNDDLRLLAVAPVTADCRSVLALELIIAGCRRT